MLASVEKLIQSGAAAGYVRTKLVGHHMDWLFFDKPAVNNLMEYEARLNHVLSKYDAPVICKLRPVQIRRQRGNGYHANAPASNYRGVTS